MNRWGIGLAVLLAGFAFSACLIADDKVKTEDKGEWKSLFDGKTLKGWKTHPDDKAKWEVKDGMIIGTGGVGHLYSEGEYSNVRFRIEGMINDKGNSGQYVRAKFAKGFPPGYETQINATHGDPIRSGSLYPAGIDKYTPEEREKMVIKEKLIKPDEWFTQEVIADGNHIVIKLNGKTTIDFVDEKNRYTKGHLAIQQHDPGTVIKVRKAEVIELPEKK